MGCNNSKEKTPKPQANAATNEPAKNDSFSNRGKNLNKSSSNAYNASASAPVHPAAASRDRDDVARARSNSLPRPASKNNFGDANNNNNNNNKPKTEAEKNAEYLEKLRNKEKSVYKMKGPTGIDADHEAIPCFKTGLLYRCVAGNVWAFYNDTQEYEMFVTVTCGAESFVTPLGSTQVTSNADGTQTFNVVVYPGDTELFWDGKFDGFKCALSAKPLSAEYRNRMIKKADERVQADIALIKSKVQSQDPETVLKACLSSNIPFVDPTFRPAASSLFREGIDSRKVAGASWMRPTHFLDEDIHTHIVKFREIEANDIDQGQLGDCWLLSAIAAVAEYPVRIERLFNHPTLDAALAAREERLGAYRITLNVNGWWTNVIVDDYLPTIGGKPCFAKNVEDPAELWAALMEKAFAKIFGSYSSITGGDALVALQDMTGYPISRFDAEWAEAVADEAKSDAFFEKLVGFDNAHFLTIVNTPGFDTAAYAGGKNDADVEERYKAAGLALGHAYTLIDVAHFPNHNNLQLCKIRNPWGNGTEWTGEWSDKCPNWSNPKFRDVASRLGHSQADDGTFWMPFADVKKYFDGGGVCFSREKWVDYRVRGAFSGNTPDFCLEISVNKPVQAYITMSQKDKRAMLAENKAYKYGAIMISVCKKAENSAEKYAVHLNSNTDPENPTDKYTFNFSRDHAMKYVFTPSADPYLIVPRIHGNTDICNFTLGLITDGKVGADLTVKFRRLDAANRVFANYPKFAYSPESAPLVEADYQMVDPKAFRAPETKRGTGIVY